MTASPPSFRALGRDEIDALLARNQVGRMAFVRSSQIDVEPVHYVYANGWLYGRTPPGRHLEVTGADWWPVAFEVDEVEDLFNWRSVVVHGGFYTLDPNGPAWQRAEAAKATQMIREKIPFDTSAEQADDHEGVLFRIGVQEVSGRAATRSREAA